MSAILKIGLPVACQDGFIQISFIVITIIANRRGVNVAAAVGIVEKIICFLFLIRIPGAYLASKLWPETLFPMGLAAPLGSLLSAFICAGAYLYLRRNDK